MDREICPVCKVTYAPNWINRHLIREHGYIYDESGTEVAPKKTARYGDKLYIADGINPVSVAPPIDKERP